MVQQLVISNIFKSLADPTRRDILSRLVEREQTISELADKYQMSFSAVAKHIRVLEKAKLITKKKNGSEQIITINGKSFEEASKYLQGYAMLWGNRFDRLEIMLKKEK